MQTQRMKWLRTTALAAMLASLLVLGGRVLTANYAGEAIAASQPTQQSNDLEEALTRGAIALLYEQFSLNEIEHTIAIAGIMVESSSARVDVQVEIVSKDLGRVRDTFHIFAIHDGLAPTHIFREPSPDFYLYADQVSPNILPPERLAFWKQLRDQEQLSLTQDPYSYKLPWTGGDSYYVYNLYGDTHFDFSMPIGDIVRAARGGIVHNNPYPDPYGAHYVRITHSDGTFGFYLHLQADSFMVPDDSPVTEGTCIARSGDTGLGGAHLHFNVSTDDGDIGGYIVISFVEGPIPSQGQTPPSQNSTADCLDTTPPTISFSSNNPAENTWYNSDMTIAWSIADNPGGSGVRGYKHAWNQNPPGGDEIPGTSGSVALSSAGQEGQQWLYVQAWDIIGNSSIPTYTGWFGYDTHAPTNPTRPANPNCTATDDVWQNTCNKPSFTWSGASDATSGVKGYGVYWGYKPNGESTHWESNPAYDALYPAQSGIPYYLRVRTKDNAGNWSDWKTLFTVKYDSTAPSNPTSVNPGCAAANNQWQNICNDANFTWSGASDGNGSGVKDYHLYWGESPSGSPSTYVTNPAYDPGLIPDGTSYYLRVGTRDNALNERIPATLFVLRYDATPPDISSFLINGGALTTTQVTVHLDLTATDSGSGVYQMRFSNNGLDWSPWEAYAPQSTWAIPALDRRTLTVYTEVRDRAGNMDSASDSIYLDLYPLPPHSDSYRICDDLLDAAGGQLTTTSYLLTSAVGQPILGHFASDSYTASAGFLARLDACLPITRPITTGITLTQWVIAAGGSLRGSTTYRLGDTAGEAAASEANAFSSASYRLTSGFWANITDTVPLPPPPPPIVTPPVPTVPPTPAPTPTPPPAGFGLLVNADDSFTNQPAVTLTLWGPGVAEMQISNDAGFDDAAWETYRISRTWTISTAGDNLDPRVVYARFRDWEGTVYGDYTDDIVYDPISPTGHVAIVARGTITVTLWLEAEDDNSSVEGVRLADDEAGLIAAPWQTFTNTVVYTPTGERIYAQFRDQALNLSTPTFASMVNRIYLPLIVRGYENSRTGEQTQ